MVTLKMYTIVRVKCDVQRNEIEMFNFLLSLNIYIIDKIDNFFNDIQFMDMKYKCAIMDESSCMVSLRLAQTIDSRRTANI